MSAQLTAFPAATSGWLLLKGSEVIARADTPVELAGRRADVVIGLPAAFVSTFSVVLPVTDSSLHGSMIYAQLEKRGFAAPAGQETVYDFVSVKRDASEETFAVSVVSNLPEELILGNATGYAPTASLQPAPAGGARLWCEHGRLVFGIYAGDVPVQVQKLSGVAEVNAATAREISLILLSLSGDEALKSSLPTGVEMNVPDVGVEALAQFEEALGLPLSGRHEGVASRSNPEGRERLLPTSVLQSRRSKRTKRKVFATLSVLLVAYLVLASWLWVKGKGAVREIESLERQIAIVEPDVTRIQQVEQRWLRLEPAFEKSWFPLVQLNRFTSALPGSGVVVREFRTSGRSIRIRGQARDVQLANRLIEDLRGMDGFASYEWSMPNPSVDKNNTATFEIEGKPKNAGADS
ncbi:MAG: hypothetical protein P1U68_13050 [Verrucomicrobiales bacterium]|nr:hypothetical protein [Verrucomicrobiales bacterium]